jgi:hypothetical protein
MFVITENIMKRPAIGIAKLGNQANSRGDFAFTFRNDERVGFRAIGLCGLLL